MDKVAMRHLECCTAHNAGYELQNALYLSKRTSHPGTRRGSGGMRLEGVQTIPLRDANFENRLSSSVMTPLRSRFITYFVNMACGYTYIPEEIDTLPGNTTLTRVTAPTSLPPLLNTEKPLARISDKFT